MSEQKFEMQFAGKTLSVTTGELAQQASGSCLVQYGDTVVLATAVISDQARENMNFFPLMVEYEEKMYAAGKIKGSRFIKRETRPADDAVLTARMIDRGLRPLFDESIRRDIQVIVTVLSIDNEAEPDVLAIIAASTAVSISNIPWNGPLAGIRVGQVDGNFVVNPSKADREKSTMDLVISAVKDKVMMVEAASNEVADATMAEAFKFALKEVQPVVDFINDITAKVGKAKLDLSAKKVEETDPNQQASDEEIAKLQEECKKIFSENIEKYLFNIPRGSKNERKVTLHKLEDLIDAYLTEKQVGKDRKKKVMEFFSTFVDEEITRAILEKDLRIDGRKLNEIRPLDAKISLLPRTHGSGLFNRGETQVLSVVTLGSPGDEQLIDGMDETIKKRYMHHYNFPPYSTGEASPLRGTGRREIGHGALAEKALVPVLPTKEEFPYTIRVVSEVLGSNGSSSMGSTCGSTLALLDAGVPIKKPVAGIAMGLASNAKGEYKVLTDIQDFEDGQGGMDFKIAGTRDGITAIQMDTKTAGINLEIIEKTIKQGREALTEILGVIENVIAVPRAEMSQYAPRIESFKINPDKIRDVIGPGGKIINKIIDETGVQIDIEQDGLVMITGAAGSDMVKAVKWVKDLTQEAVVGQVYEGEVARILDFGAFVNLFGDTDGMVHISEITNIERVTDINKYLKIGQRVKVKVMKVDEKGRVNLTMKGIN